MMLNSKFTFTQHQNHTYGLFVCEPLKRTNVLCMHQYVVCVIVCMNKFGIQLYLVGALHFSPNVYYIYFRVMFTTYEINAWHIENICNVFSATPSYQMTQFIFMARAHEHIHIKYDDMGHIEQEQEHPLQ